MPRKYRSRGRPRQYSADEYRRRERSFFAPIRRFFQSVMVAILVIVGIVVAFCLLLLIAFHFATFVLILIYALYVGAGLAVFGVLYLMVRIGTAISHRLSAASTSKAKAKLERERVRIVQEKVHQARNQVHLQQAKLAQQEYTFYRKQEEQSDSYYTSPRRTRVIRQEPPEELEQEEYKVPGMPTQTLCYYRDYTSQVQPGQLIIGARANGTVRIGTWADFKVLLILGGSASGKTSTMVEKCLGAVNGGGLLAVCDAHGHKDDSLLNRIYPLQSSLLPGTVLAIEHTDIRRNFEIVKQELDRRVRGGDCRTPVFLIVEELNRLQRDKSMASALTEILQIIGQEGRGYNVFAIIGAQQITYLSEIRKSVISFVIHRVDEAESKLCIPTRFAKYSPELKPGQSFVKDADGTTEALLQVYVTVEDIQAAAHRLALRKVSIQQKPLHAQPTQRMTRPVEQRDQENRSYGYPAHQLRKTQLVDTSQSTQLPPRQRSTTNNLHLPSASSTWGGQQEDTILVPEPIRRSAPQTDELFPTIKQSDVVKAIQKDVAQQKLEKLAMLKKNRKK